MLYTFVCDYVFGGGAVIQVHAFDHARAYKIPAFEDEPEYFPFEKVTLIKLSAYHTADITSDGLICIWEFV